MTHASPFFYSFIELLPDQPAGKEGEQPGAFDNCDKLTNPIWFWVRMLNLNNWCKTNIQTDIDTGCEETTWLI